MAEKMKDLSIENARLIFKNFSGKESKYNPAGKRDFSVILSPEDGEALAEQGWNIKQKEAADGTLLDPTLRVKVNFDSYMPPKIWLKVGNRKPELMTEETVGSLDFAEPENVDLIINPSRWEMNDKSGIAAYLKAMYVTLPANDLEDKFFGNTDDEEGDFLPFN